MSRMARWVVGVLSGCVLLLGCGNAHDAAREQFGREFSCPLDRVTVRPRDDIKWSTVALHASAAEPPHDVKRDPARYAKWKKDQEELNGPMRDLLDSFDVFEGKGCGHDVLLGCKRPAKSSRLYSIVCMVEPLPGARAR